MAYQIADFIGQLLRILFFYYESCFAFVYDAGDSAFVRADAGQPLLHGFKQNEGEAFVGVMGGENENVSILKKLCFFFAEFSAEIEDKAKFYPPL